MVESSQGGVSSVYYLDKMLYFVTAEGGTQADIA